MTNSLYIQALDAGRFCRFCAAGSPCTNKKRQSTKTQINVPESTTDRKPLSVFQTRLHSYYAVHVYVRVLEYVHVYCKTASAQWCYLLGTFGIVGLSLIRTRVSGRLWQFSCVVAPSTATLQSLGLGFCYDYFIFVLQ